MLFIKVLFKFTVDFFKKQVKKTKSESNLSSHLLFKNYCKPSYNQIQVYIKQSSYNLYKKLILAQINKLNYEND